MKTANVTKDVLESQPYCGKTTIEEIEKLFSDNGLSLISKIV